MGNYRRAVPSKPSIWHWTNSHLILLSCIWHRAFFFLPFFKFKSGLNVEFKYPLKSFPFEESGSLWLFFPPPLLRLFQCKKLKEDKEGYRKTTWNFLMKPPSVYKWTFKKHNTLKMSFGIKPKFKCLISPQAVETQKNWLGRKKNSKADPTEVSSPHAPSQTPCNSEQVGQRTMKK